jgi:hypothetical protein
MSATDRAMLQELQGLAKIRGLDTADPASEGGLARLDACQHCNFCPCMFFG